MFSKLYNKLDNFNKYFVEYNKDHHDENISIIKNMAKQIGIKNDIDKIFSDTLQIKNKINEYIKLGFYTLFIKYIINTLRIDIATDDFNQILFDKLTKDNQDELNDENRFEINNIKINKRLYLKHRLYLFIRRVYNKLF